MLTFSLAPPTAIALSDKLPWTATTTRTITRRIILPLLPLPLLTLVPKPSVSASSQTTAYDSYAASYDTLDGSNILTKFLGFDTARKTLLSHAHGDVVEFGIGTGQNLLYYPNTITSLTGIDTSDEMLQIAKTRKETVKFPVILTRTSAESTQLESTSFDTVVDTFSLCVYEHPFQALREMRRLLKPGGTALLLEHTAGDGLVRIYQDLTAGVVKRMSKSCLPNQRVMDMVLQVGFHVVEETRILGGTVIALRLV